jgi:hypothetical protein
MTLDSPLQRLVFKRNRRRLRDQRSGHGHRWVGLQADQGSQGGRYLSSYVCLSFAGEDRNYVSEVAEELTKKEVRVFYDKYEEVDLWGKELYEHLDHQIGDEQIPRILQRLDKRGPLGYGTRRLRWGPADGCGAPSLAYR